MNGLLYEFKPFAMFAVGFLSGNLEHPAKWITVLSLIIAAIVIQFWRYKAREEHILIGVPHNAGKLSLFISHIYRLYVRHIIRPIRNV